MKSVLYLVGALLIGTVLLVSVGLYSEQDNGQKLQPAERLWRPVLPRDLGGFANATLQLTEGNSSILLWILAMI